MWTRISGLCMGSEVSIAMWRVTIRKLKPQWVHIQTMMTHTQIIFHTTLSVLLGRAQSPNMPQQYHEQHNYALRPTPPLTRKSTTPCSGQRRKKNTYTKAPRACFGAYNNNSTEPVLQLWSICLQPVNCQQRAAALGIGGASQNMPW